MKTISASDFENEVLGNTQPVLVDFYTDTCPPCRQVAAVLQEIANDHLQDAAKPRDEQLRSVLERLLADRDAQIEMLRQIERFRRETTTDAAQKKSQVLHKHWKKLERRDKEREAQLTHKRKVQQARRAAIIDRLLRIAQKQETH